MYNWKPKLAEVDPDNPNAWARCDKCGFVTNIDKMAWQYAYRGSMNPINTMILTCGRQTCLDPLNPQDAPLILPPDPLPVFNARPFPYTLEETSWLGTEDGDTLTTQDDVPLITPVPTNPDTPGNTTYLTCTISAPSASVATLYLDLFDGDPSNGGRSVLADITGSSTRTNIADELSTTGRNIATNTDVITVAAASENAVNVSYAGLYSASISGALLMSGPVSASPTIAQDNPVQFNALGLAIDLN